MDDQSPKVVVSTLTIVCAAKLTKSNIDNLLNWLPDALRADFNVRLALDIEDSKFDSALVEKLRDKGLEVLKSGNFGGPGLARNELLANFKSDYVVFWDADDFPHVETIRKFLNHYTGDKKKFIVGQWELRQVGKKTSRSSDSNLSSVAFQPGLWRILCPSVVISGELFPATRMGEDQVYLFNIGFFREQPVWEDSIFYSYNTGQQEQLTQNTEAINDIEIAIAILANKRLRNQTKPIHRQLMILRMITTYWFKAAGPSTFQKFQFTCKILLSLQKKKFLPLTFGLYIYFNLKRVFGK